MKKILIILSFTLSGCTAEYWNYMASTPPVPRPCSVYDPNLNITSYIPCPTSTYYYYYNTPYYSPYRYNTKVVVVESKDNKKKVSPTPKQEPRRTSGVDRSNRTTSTPSRPPQSNVGKVERTNKGDNRQ